MTGFVRDTTNKHDTCMVKKTYAKKKNNNNNFMTIIKIFIAFLCKYMNDEFI